MNSGVIIGDDITVLLKTSFPLWAWTKRKKEKRKLISDTQKTSKSLFFFSESFIFIPQICL